MGVWGFRGFGGRYIELPVSEINTTSKYKYLSLRANQYQDSIDIGDKIKKHSKPFESLSDPNRQPKYFQPNTETSQLSWAERHIIQPTSNFESANFNIINHQLRKGVSIGKLIVESPRVCQRMKGITEYCDLGRVTAIKPNKDYNNSLKDHPKGFLRTKGICGYSCDLVKMYGPGYKLFK